MVGRIMSMKNSKDKVGNRTRNLPACGAVLQPTTPQRAFIFLGGGEVNEITFIEIIFRYLERKIPS